MKKTIKAYAIVINGEVDLHYDIYRTRRVAVEYKNKYRSMVEAIVPCTISYVLPKSKKK